MKQDEYNTLSLIWFPEWNWKCLWKCFSLNQVLLSNLSECRKDALQNQQCLNTNSFSALPCCNLNSLFHLFRDRCGFIYCFVDIERTDTDIDAISFNVWYSRWQQYWFLSFGRGTRFIGSCHTHENLTLSKIIWNIL